MQFSMQTVLGLVTLLAFSDATHTCLDGYGCARYPANCGDTGQAACDIVVNWQADDADGIQFTTQAKTTGTNPRWLGIGFSEDKEMGQDDILICRQTDNQADVVLEHYWSVGPPNSTTKSIVKETASITADGLTNVVTAQDEGYVICNFTRAVMVPGKDHVYDLSKTTTADMMPFYYWFIGTGSVVSDAPQQHDVDPYISTAAIDYTATGEQMVEPGSSEEGSDSHEAASNIMASMMLLVVMTCLAIYLH
ncbi:DOMON domain-containing protein FRRS1L-like [Amphiura filiformis]|uniref:DOMON domain-containing protein FRRS1L-like n=1 Tax=Amphiura filiformis TaxID=82378 RepID=UPI003B223266